MGNLTNKKIKIGYLGLETVVEIHSLKKNYGSLQALKGINLSIKKGEIFGILGPNGAGKTTTVEIISGLRSADEGNIKVLSYNPNTERQKLSGKIALQPQTINFLDRLKVKEIIYGFRSFYDNPKNVEEVLEKVGLQDKLNSFFKDLSGGQKQRLNFAIALISNALLYILDEPTSGLDPQGRANIHQLIKELKNEGKTIILTTHYIEEAQKLCDKIAIIDEGKIIAEGEPKKLIESYSNKVRIELNGNFPENFFTDINGIISIAQEQNNITIRSSKPSATLIAIFEKATSADIKITKINLFEPTLEDVYLELTGRKYRD